MSNEIEEYSLDPAYKIPANQIQPNHMSLVQHEHNVVTGVKFYTYYESANGYYTYDLIMKNDWSKYVIDYSYDCDMDDNTRTSASVTLSNKDLIDDLGVVKMEHRQVVSYISPGHSQGYVWDENTYYRLVKTYYFPRTGQTVEWDLGYFVCSSNQTSLSITDSTVTITLIGLSALLQPEYGGTPNRYREARMADTVIKKVTPTIDARKVRPSQSGEYIGVVVYEGNPDVNNKQTVSEDIADEQKYWTITYEPKTITQWSLMTPFFPYGTEVTNTLIYDSVMGSWAQPVSAQDMSRVLPIKGCIMDRTGMTINVIREDKEFPYDASRKDVIDYLIQTIYEEGHYWVDESGYLQTRGRQEQRSNVADYREYGDLVMSEVRSYDDSGCYNAVNVVSNVTIDGYDCTFFGRAENAHTIQGTNVRALYIEDNTLQSDQECEDKARLECWRYSFGHETFSVTLSDNYCGFLTYASTKVGKTIEYRTMEGYTVVCLLQKISYSSNTITLLLKTYKPSKSPELENEGSVLEPDIVPNETLKRTLGKPVISSGVVMTDSNGNTFIRLTVTGADINYGYIRIYDSGMYGVHAEGNSGGTVDVPVSENGTYSFRAQLFSPLFEDSIPSDIFTISVTGINNKANYVIDPVTHKPKNVDTGEEIDTDIYPHKPVDLSQYILNEDDKFVTSENDGKIFI